MYTTLALAEVRLRERELKHERDRADLLHDALDDIARKKIMDERTAINMRAIATAALASESRW